MTGRGGHFLDFVVCDSFRMGAAAWEVFVGAKNSLVSSLGVVIAEHPGTCGWVIQAIVHGVKV